jgi:maltose O-acetyltransferase
MPLKSLNRLRPIRTMLLWVRSLWLRYGRGIDLHPTAMISLSSRILPGERGSISIGRETLVAFKTLIYSYDQRVDKVLPVKIGRHCFIGGGSMILPGVTIGDEAIVGGGAVVATDVPSRCIVGGNPARIVRTEIDVGRFGRLAGADENTRLMWGVD